MAAGYNAFIANMLNKRGQDWEAAKYRDQKKEEEFDQMLKAGQQIGGSLISAQKQFKEDATYNKMLDSLDAGTGQPEYAPGIGLVPGAGAKHTGGKQEFDALMKMRELDSKSFGDSVRQANYELAVRRQSEIEDWHKTQRTAQATERASKGTKDTYSDIDAITKEIQLANDAAAKADTPEQYQTAVQRAGNWYKTAQTRKLPIDPPSIPMFKADRAANEAAKTEIDAQRETLKGLQAQKPGGYGADTPVVGWGRTGPEELKSAIKLQQDTIAEAEAKAKAANTGYGLDATIPIDKAIESRYRGLDPSKLSVQQLPQQTGSAPQSGGSGKQPPLGYTIVNPTTKEQQVWTANGWRTLK